MNIKLEDETNKNKQLELKYNALEINYRQSLSVESKVEGLQFNIEKLNEINSDLKNQIDMLQNRYDPLLN